MSEGCFLTGTDTGVGKTIVTAALAMVLRRRGFAAGVMKPVETGVGTETRSDAVRLARAAGTADPLELIRPYSFRRPLAPLAAARVARQTVEAGRIEDAFRALSLRHPIMLVEGIGGVRVPLGEKLDVLELIRRLGLPAVVVGRCALGGVNHALVTLDALHRHGIPVLGLILNHTSVQTGSARSQSASTAALLREHAGCRVFGPLPYVPVRRRWERIAATLSRHPELRRLADLLTSPPAAA